MPDKNITIPNSQVISKWISKMRLKSRRPVEYLMHHPGQFMELDTTSRAR